MGPQQGLSCSDLWSFLSGGTDAWNPSVCCLSQHASFSLTATSNTNQTSSEVITRRPRCIFSLWGSYWLLEGASCPKIVGGLIGCCAECTGTEGPREQQLKSRTRTSSTEIITKWLLPRATPSQKYHTSVYLQLWPLAPFTPAELSFPMQAPSSGPHLGKKSNEGLVAVELLPISKWVLKHFCSKLSRETGNKPSQAEPPQSLLTLLTTLSRGNSALSHKIKLSLYSPV